MKTTRFTLALRDYLKAFIMAVGAPVLTFIIDSLKAETIVYDWKKLLIVAISAGAAYLVKNFFTDDIKVAKEVLIENNVPLKSIK